MAAHPGDSRVQRRAEAVATRLLEERFGVGLAKRVIPLPGGGHLEVDAASDTPPILCEIWAHQGAPKSAQKAKVMTDALKLVYARSLLVASGAAAPRLVIAFSDEPAARHFREKSWMAAALAELDVEIEVVELPQDVRTAVQQAQIRQRR